MLFVVKMMTSYRNNVEFRLKSDDLLIKTQATLRYLSLTRYSWSDSEG